MKYTFFGILRCENPKSAHVHVNPVAREMLRTTQNKTAIKQSRVKLISELHITDPSVTNYKHIPQSNMKHWSDSYQQLSKTTPNLSERATLFLSLSLSNTHTHARTHLHAHLLPMITTFCLEVEPETVGIIWKLGGHSSCSSSREAWETCFCIIYIYIYFLLGMMMWCQGRA